MPVKGVPPGEVEPDVALGGPVVLEVEDVDEPVPLGGVEELLLLEDDDVGGGVVDVGGEVVGVGVGDVGCVQSMPSVTDPWLLCVNPSPQSHDSFAVIVPVASFGNVSVPTLTLVSAGITCPTAMDARLDDVIVVGPKLFEPP